MADGPSVDAVSERVGVSVGIGCLALDFGGTLTNGTVDVTDARLAEDVRYLRGRGYRVVDTTVDRRAAGAVRWLRGRGFKILLASNVSVADPPRRQALHQAGILDCFDGLVLSTEVGYSKPHRAFYCAVLKVAGCDPDQVLFVGNRVVNDILGPLAHGMRAAFINPFGEDGGAPEFVPVLRHVADLPDLVDIQGAPADSLTRAG